jgi:hypothetical protein
MSKHDLDSDLTSQAPPSESIAESWPPVINDPQPTRRSPDKRRLSPPQAFFGFVGMFIATLPTSVGLCVLLNIIASDCGRMWPSTQRLLVSPLFYFHPSNDPDNGVAGSDLLFLTINVVVLILTIRFALLRKGNALLWGFCAGFVLWSFIFVFCSKVLF